MPGISGSRDPGINSLLAGLLTQASSLMALCCPNVNCYRRLGGCFAPTFADWSIDDRNATIYVKNYGPKET